MCVYFFQNHCINAKTCGVNTVMQYCTKSFEQYRDDGVYIETAKVSVRLTCSHKHYWLSRGVRHGDCRSHLYIQGRGEGVNTYREEGVN